MAFIRNNLSRVSSSKGNSPVVWSYNGGLDSLNDISMELNYFPRDIFRKNDMIEVISFAASSGTTFGTFLISAVNPNGSFIMIRHPGRSNQIRNCTHLLKDPDFIPSEGYVSAGTAGRLLHIMAVISVGTTTTGAGEIEFRLDADDPLGSIVIPNASGPGTVHILTINQTVDAADSVFKAEVTKEVLGVSRIQISYAGSDVIL